jgi:hypothetical protein
MWSDTLLAAERSHLLHLAVWGATSVFIATTVVVLVTHRRIAAPIVHWFAIQGGMWGAAELVVALVRWQTLAMRDVSAATRLDRLTWFNAGLDVGIIGVGATIAVLAWIRPRRLSAVGAGLGILVQGLGLLVINLTFASMLARLV